MMISLYGIEMCSTFLSFFSKHTILPVLENRFGSNDIFMIKKIIALDLCMHDGH